MTIRTRPAGVNLSGVSAFAPGIAHTLAVTGDGKGWAWGGNSNGRLGDGTTNNTATPPDPFDGLLVP